MVRPISEVPFTILALGFFIYLRFAVLEIHPEDHPVEDSESESGSEYEHDQLLWDWEWDTGLWWVGGWAVLFWYQITCESEEGWHQLDWQSQLFLGPCAVFSNIKLHYDHWPLRLKLDFDVFVG